jgi:hypothetical protein
MRNAPLVASGALPETEQKVLIESVRHATVTTVEPCRRMCPLCRCHAECRGWWSR